jgi:REP element-mobilizing transposase RayT
MSSPPPLLLDTHYHIYTRGTNRENIFIEERNYAHFLNLLARHIEPVADVFAYCMLRNHFHIAVRTKSLEEILGNQKTLKVSTANEKSEGQDTLVSQGKDQARRPLGSAASRHFANFFNAYAKAINNAYGRTGSLFQHPFGRVPITTDRQFWAVIAYIHQNPQKHGFVSDFREWKYSSYGLLLSDQRTFLSRDEVMHWFGGREEYLSLHGEWVTDAQSRPFAADDFD